MATSVVHIGFKSIVARIFRALSEETREYKKPLHGDSSSNIETKNYREWSGFVLCGL
jgi:hypothetical protein